MHQTSSKENNVTLHHLVQGALATAGKYCLNSWAVAKKGPSYPPMFNPLSVAFTVVLGSIFIGDVVTTSLWEGPFSVAFLLFLTLHLHLLSSFLE